MKKVNIGNKEFSVELNKSSDNQMYKMLMDWKDEIEKGKKEDLWYQISALPQFLFKGLKIVDTSMTENSDTNDVTITFKYDDWQKNT